MSLLSWITEKEVQREIKKKKAKAANFVTRIMRNAGDRKGENGRK